MFNRNVGTLDRTIRLTVGIVLITLGLFVLDGLDGSVFALVLAAPGLIGVMTADTGFCPLYVPLGISTVKRERSLSL